MQRLRQARIILATRTSSSKYRELRPGGPHPRRQGFSMNQAWLLMRTVRIVPIILSISWVSIHWLTLDVPGIGGHLLQTTESPTDAPWCREYETLLPDIMYL